MKIERVVLALFIVALLARALSVYYAYTNFNTGESSAATARSIHQVIEAVYQIKFKAVEVENTSNKYSLSHQPYYARLTSENAASLNNSLQALLDSVKNKPLELQKVSEIEKLAFDMEKALPGTDSLDVTLLEREPKTFRAELPENLINGIIAKSNELVTTELKSLEVWRNSVIESRRKSLDNAYYTALTGLLFVVAVLYFLNRGILRRRRAESLIRQNEERLRKIIEDVGDVIYSSDYNGKFTFINSRLEALAGYTTEELIGQHFSFLVHPDWVNGVNEFYYQQFKNKTYETRFEFPIITKKGEIKWVEQNVVMVSGEKMVEGFQCVVRDITRRKNAEEEIRHTNQFLDSILENIPNMIFIKDAKDLRFLRFNKAGEQLLGHSQEDMLGKNDYDFFPKEQADFFIEKDKEVFKAHQGVDILEEPIHTIRGSRWLHTKKIPVYDALGAPLYLLGISEDITERKKTEDTIIDLNKNLARYVAELEESQRFYRTIAHNFPDGTISVINQNLDYLFVDGRELALEGLNAEKLIGTPYLNRFPEGTRDNVKNKLSEIFKGNDVAFEVFLSENYYMVHGAPLHTTDKKVTEILLVKQNITKLKVAEQNMKAALEKEKQINELKSRFVSLASHEFRTPLSTILSSTELIGEYIEHVEKNPALIRDKNIHHLKRIKSSIQNMVNILNSFLSLDQLEQGKTLTVPQNFDVKKLSQEIVDELQGNLKHSQKISYAHESVPTSIFMDRSILKNVASNLLTNAIKYSPENSTIKYVTKVTSSGLEFTVEDHGIGIPETEQSSLFERFFRAKNTLNIEGTGLGLSIVKKYIDLLNGHISFTSRENEGSIFKVFIANAIPITINNSVKEETT